MNHHEPVWNKLYKHLTKKKSVKSYIYSKIFSWYTNSQPVSQRIQFHILKFYSSMLIFAWYVAFIIYKKIEQPSSLKKSNETSQQATRPIWTTNYFPPFIGSDIMQYNTLEEILKQRKKQNKTQSLIALNNYFLENIHKSCHRQTRICICYIHPSGSPASRTAVCVPQLQATKYSCLSFEVSITNSRLSYHILGVDISHCYLSWRSN